MKLWLCSAWIFIGSKEGWKGAWQVCIIFPEVVLKYLKYMIPEICLLYQIFFKLVSVKKGTLLRFLDFDLKWCIHKDPREMTECIS